VHLHVSSKAEQVAARMMVESRLKGSIDQIDKLIQFETGMCRFLRPRHRADVHSLLPPPIFHVPCAEGGSLYLWDRHIESACHAVNIIVENLGVKYPQFIQS
jgi:hypothetical protein